MRYLVLATDYDGTLAHDGRVSESTVQALQKLLESGRRLVMVTGRELPELISVFPQLDLFEWVVAENGALLYRPSSKQQKPLADPPTEKFVNALRDRGVGPISVGRVIVATWEPHEKTVLQIIHEQGLELQVIFNKGAVMVLPAGVNKASGLKAALKEMAVSPHNVVGVGDAENDHAFLQFCELSAAVANALPAVKDTADVVTKADHGDGVSELIGGLLADDLAPANARLSRRSLAIGKHRELEIGLSAYGPNVLIAGPSASGKSTVATRLIEALAEQKYQLCIIDPEGDYESFAGPVVLGGPNRPVTGDDVSRLLENPAENVIVSLTGLPIADRPQFFQDLLPKLLQMRARTGRPHWLILDEAHHLLPAEWQPPDGLLPERLPNVLLITVHPDLLAPALVQRIDTLIAVGADAAATVQSFARTVHAPLPAFKTPPLEPGEVLFWSRDADALSRSERRPSSSGSAPIQVRAYPCKTERLRHRRKYAEGEPPPRTQLLLPRPRRKAPPPRPEPDALLAARRRRRRRNLGAPPSSGRLLPLVPRVHQGRRPRRRSRPRRKPPHRRPRRHPPAHPHGSRTRLHAVGVAAAAGPRGRLTSRETSARTLKRELQLLFHVKHSIVAQLRGIMGG